MDHVFRVLSTLRTLGSMALGPLEVKEAMKGVGLVPNIDLTGVSDAVGDLTDSV